MKTGGSLKAVDRLERAYFEMLETTHYTKISVSDIIEKASVSRTTFYRHYVDIFDMHEKVADRLCSILVNTCIKDVLIEGGNDVYEKIAEILCSQDKYINLIAGSNGSRYLFESVYNNAKKFMAPAMNFLSEETVFRLNFIIVATISMYVKDILKGREHRTEFIGICKNIISFDNIRGGIYGE